MNTIGFGLGRTRTWLLVPALCALFLAASAADSSGLAQTDKNNVTPVSPVEEFSQQLQQLKKNFAELSAKIEERAKLIDKQTGVEASRQEIAELRAIVGTLLGAVADNGDVSRLGAKALNHAQNKLKTLREETRYTPEQREFLMQEWQKLATETERASKELESARTRFAKLLRTLQINDDYVGELIEVRQGHEALKIIRGLAKEIHEASDMLNNFINTIAPPRTGT